MQHSCKSSEKRKIMQENSYSYQKTVKIIYNKNDIKILQNGEIAMIIDVYSPKGTKKTLTALIKELQEAVAKLTLQEAANWEEQRKFNKEMIEFKDKQETFNEWVKDVFKRNDLK